MPEKIAQGTSVQSHTGGVSRRIKPGKLNEGACGQFERFAPVTRGSPSLILSNLVINFTSAVHGNPRTPNVPTHNNPRQVIALAINLLAEVTRGNCSISVKS